MEAQLDDPEVVAWALAQPEPTGPGRPALQDFTPELEALTNIIDQLGQVTNAVLVAGGRKPLSIKPFRRPLTGIERARAQREKQRHLSLVDEVKAAQERWKRQREEG